MKKIFKIFNPSNNWKTTLFLIVLIATLTFFLTLLMGYEFTNESGRSESYYLLAKDPCKSLRYIWKIFDTKPNKAFVNFEEEDPVYSAAYVYALISNYNLLIYILWFIIPISFTLNHFRVIHLVGKVRRTANASIVFISAIVLLILVINYWIGYYEWVDIMNKNKWKGCSNWGTNWRTTTQQSILIISVVIFISMSLYNIIVEQKTKYLSISSKMKEEIAKEILSSNDKSTKPKKLNNKNKEITSNNNSETREESNNNQELI